MMANISTSRRQSQSRAISCAVREHLRRAVSRVLSTQSLSVLHNSGSMTDTQSYVAPSCAHRKDGELLSLINSEVRRWSLQHCTTSTWRSRTSTEYMWHSARSSTLHKSESEGV